jgi:anti-anti-sigma factor
VTTEPEPSDLAQFRIEVEPARDAVRVAPVGEVDLATVDELREEIDRLSEAGFTRLVLDLRQVLFLDSTGLRLILDLDANARTNGWEFTLVRGTKSVQRIFDVTLVTDRLRFVEP